MSKNPTNRKVGEVLNIEIKKGTEEIPKTIYAELARCFFSEITEFYNNQRTHLFLMKQVGSSVCQKPMVNSAAFKAPSMRAAQAGLSCPSDNSPSAVTTAS